MVKTHLNAPVPFKGTDVITLPNGLRLILKEDHGCPVVSMQVWARCGGIDEVVEKLGISHGLEHMVFKGTTSRSAGEISHFIERHGGHMNAATQLETTHYYIDIPSSAAFEALSVIIDILLNPTFPQDELEREKLVILEEIHSRNDNPDASLWDDFSGSVFKGTPYGSKVIGTEKTVSALTRDDLKSYYKAYYVPSNICLVMVGDFNRDEIIRELETRFRDYQKGTAPTFPTVQLNGHQPSHMKLKKPVQFAHFAMGFPTIGLNHSDLVAVDLLTDILGGSLSSRLYQSLREEKQWVYSLSADFTPFQVHGLFSVFGEGPVESVEKSIAEIEKQIQEVSTKRIKDSELQRAKRRIKSEWLHGSESPRGQASTLGSLGIANHLNLIETYLDQIDRLTPDDLMRAFDQHFKQRPMTTCQLLPG